jgi:hypothetical protein
MISANILSNPQWKKFLCQTLKIHVLAVTNSTVLVSDLTASTPIIRAIFVLPSQTRPLSPLSKDDVQGRRWRSAIRPPAASPKKRAENGGSGNEGRSTVPSIMLHATFAMWPSCQVRVELWCYNTLQKIVCCVVCKTILCLLITTLWPFLLFTRTTKSFHQLQPITGIFNSCRYKIFSRYR